MAEGRVWRACCRRWRPGAGQPRRRRRICRGRRPRGQAGPGRLARGDRHGRRCWEAAACCGDRSGSRWRKTVSRRATGWQPLRPRSATLFRPSNPYSSWRTCSNPYLARAVADSRVSTGAEGGLENAAGRDSRLWRRNASSLKTTASLLWATRGARLDPSADRSTPLTGGVFSDGVHQVSGDYGVDSALMRYRAVGRFGSPCWVVVVVVVLGRPVAFLQRPPAINPKGNRKSSRRVRGTVMLREWSERRSRAGRCWGAPSRCWCW